MSLLYGAALSPTPPGQTAELAQVTETDIAQVLGKTKQKALIQAVSTEIAQPVGRSKSKLLNQVVETSTAQPVNPVGSQTLVQVTETAIAQALANKTKTKALAQVTEAETAQALAKTKAKSFAQVTETDLAQTLAGAKQKTAAQVIETDLTQALTKTKQKTLIQTVEQDTAQPVTSRVCPILPSVRPNGTGTVSNVENEADQTTNLHLSVDDDPDANDGETTHLRRNDTTADASCFLLLGDTPANFSSVCRLVARFAVKADGVRVDDTVVVYGQVFASNETTALTDEMQLTSLPPLDTGSYATSEVTFTGVTAGDKTTWDGARLRLRWDYTQGGVTPDLVDVRVTAVELNGSYLAVSGAVAVTQVIETDLAQAVGRTKQKALAQVSSGHIAQPVTRLKSRVLAQVTETSSVQALGKTKVQAVNQVTEQDTAQPVAEQSSRTLVQALESDTVTALTHTFARTLTRLTETDLAQALTEAKAKGVIQLTETDLAQRLTVGYKAVHLTAQAADPEVTGSGTKHKAAFAPGSASVVRNKNTALGPTAPLQATDSAVAGTDGAAVSWYSPRLKAMTIAGEITVELWDRESSGLANVAPTIRIERCSSTGTVLSTIVSETVNHGAGEMGTTAGGASDTFTVTAANVTDTTLVDGDRIRFTLWIDDLADQGGLPAQVMGTGENAQFYVNGSRGSAGQAAFTFTETLLPFGGAALAQVTETDLAQVLIRARQRALGQVVGTELARPLTRAKSKVLAQVTEADQAQVVARALSRTLTPVIETELAQPVSHALSRTLTRATETDVAGPLGRLRARTVSQAVETELAQAITPVIGLILGGHHTAGDTGPRLSPDAAARLATGTEPRELLAQT